MARRTIPHQPAAAARRTKLSVPTAAADDLGACSARIVATARNHACLRRATVARLIELAVYYLDQARVVIRQAPDLSTPLRQQQPDADDGLDFRTFALPRDQMQILGLALQRAMELTRNRHPSTNLGLMALDFLATGDWGKAKDPLTRVRYLAKMERLMGIRIVAFSGSDERAVYVSPHFGPSFWTG